MNIGVLALQGDFAEHIVMLKRLGVEADEVRLPGQLDGLDGLIIPGGESTTIGKLAEDFKLDGAAARIWKITCHLGHLRGRHLSFEGCPPRTSLCSASWISPLSAMPSARQVDSFEADLDIEPLKKATRTTDAVSCGVHPRADHPVGQREGEDPLRAAGWPHCCGTGRKTAGDLLPPGTDEDLRFHEFFISLAK